MLTATIERGIEVNGTLFNALAAVQESPNCTAAQARTLISGVLRHSRIYRVEVRNNELLVLSQFHNHVLARVSQ